MFGKTSTREIVSHVLETEYTVFKTKKNFNGMRGLPITCSQIENEELAVIEMGMDGLRTNSKIINNDKAIYWCNYNYWIITHRKASEVLKIYCQQRWKLYLV